MSHNVKLENVAQTLAFGRQIASVLQPADSVFLHGDLGAGKTTLVRGILNGLGHLGHVKSPTFTLVEPYSLENHDVYHFDLYRLNAPEELEDIGFRDYLHANAICLIEWPEKAEGFLPKPSHEIDIKIHNEQRIVTWQKI